MKSSSTLGRSDGVLSLLLFLLFGAGLYVYFLPGDLLGLDTHSHLGRTWLYKDIITNEGSFPIWTNRWYFGFPIGLYYGFLYYLLAALTTVIFFGNVVIGTKVFLWALHVSSGISLFYFCRYLTASLPAALFSAIFYTFSLQHIGTIIKAGRLPLSIIFLLLPLTFYLLERLERTARKSIRTAPLMAFLLTLALFTHLQYGIYTLLAYCLACVSQMTVRYLNEKNYADLKQSIGFLLMTGLFYLIFSAWFLIPALQDKSELVLSSSNAMKELWGKFSTDQAIEIISQELGYRTGKNPNVYYIGLFPLLICLFAWNQKRYSYHFLSYLLIFIVSFALTLRIPRFINIWFFFACVISSYGVVGIQNLMTLRLKRASLYCMPALFIILFMDLGTQQLKPSRKKIDNSKISEIQQELRRNGEIGRILVLTQSRSTLWRSLDVIGTDASTPFGGIPQTSTRTHPFATAIVSKASHEFFSQDKQFTEATIDALSLLNIRYIWVPKKHELIKIPEAAPIWFGQKIAELKRKSNRLENATWAAIRNNFDKQNLDLPYIETLLAELTIDKKNHSFSKLLISDAMKPNINPDLASPLDENKKLFSLVDHQETHHSVLIRYQSDADGYAFLPYSFFPHNKVEVDGVKVEAYKSAMNFTIVPVIKGAHTLVIHAGISATRKVLLALAGIGILAWMLIIFKTK